MPKKANEAEGAGTASEGGQAGHDAPSESSKAIRKPHAERNQYTHYRGPLPGTAWESSDTGVESDTEPIESRDLRVELEIERGGPCVMDRIDGDIVGVDVFLQDGQCRVDVDVRKDRQQTSTKQFTSEICDHCPGAVFPKYGCIPRYLDVGTGSFVMETYLENSDAVSSLVTELRDRCERVKIHSLTSTDQQNYTEPCTVDLTPLTPKQRQAIHVAQELGYYEPCSDVELRDVAEKLDISPSALSQRLQRGEANVLEQLSCHSDCRDSLPPF